MYECIVCGNCFLRTKRTRPKLIYHRFPKNPSLRIKWLKVYGINRISTSHRVCSDHFLNKDYKSLRKGILLEDSIPQPYDRKKNKNGSLTNSTAQSNAMQIEDNTFLSTEQDLSREEYIENSVVQTKQFKRQIPANENIQTVIKKVVEPVATTSKNFELKCSIPGCLTSTDEDVDDLSFFTPTIECISEWSLILGLQLTVNTTICERHFRPQDILDHESSKNTLKKRGKSLIPSAKPVPINAKQSSSNARNYVLDNTSMSKIDFSTIELNQKLKKMLANNSVSITVSKPITPHSTTNNGSPSNRIPSTSSCSLNNIPQTSLSQHEQEAMSTSVISKCTSSGTIDSNSDHTYLSKRKIIDDDTIRYFKVKDAGFIYEISKIVEFPSLFWESVHVVSQNKTSFYQRDDFETIVKRIHFNNSLVPIIIIYNKKYNFKVPIKSKNELKILLEKINIIDKCSGIDEKYMGGFEESYLELRNKMLRAKKMPTLNSTVKPII